MRSISVLYMSMSLDGYIAGPNDEPDNPGGDGFMRLHEWYGFEAPPPNTMGTGWGAHFMDEVNATGAVLADRRTVEQVDYWGGNHHGVPIFVPSHRPPGPSVANYPFVTYVTDGIKSAMAQAKAAAGDSFTTMIWLSNLRSKKLSEYSTSHLTVSLSAVTTQERTDRQAIDQASLNITDTNLKNG